jgi:hypothetical protein
MKDITTNMTIFDFFASKKLLFVIFSLGITVSLSAQTYTWTTTGNCGSTSPTIDKVFVDACADPESQNEFAYMTVGTASFDWSNMESLVVRLM